MSGQIWDSIERTWQRGRPGDRVVILAGCPFKRLARRLEPEFSPEVRAEFGRIARRFVNVLVRKDTIEAVRASIQRAVERERPDLQFRLDVDEVGYVTVIWSYRKGGSHER